jgi:protein-S-isoprenylcysteine O-methyltransferase Ste14
VCALPTAVADLNRAGVTIDTVTAVAAVLDAVFLGVAFGVRTVIQRRRTGDSGWRLGRPHSVAEGAARGLMVASLFALGVALLTTDARPPVWLAVPAVVIAVAAIALVAAAQLRMGESWRIGVDPEERTALIRSGLYAQVRNPIYTGMAVFVVCHAVLTPSAWALAGALAMIVGVQIQVRLVEEPYLERVHGSEFRDWMAMSGRFVPGIG